MRYKELIATVSVAQIIRKKFPKGKKKGPQWITFCPFHRNENTPALGVKLSNGIYGCFSCGASGNFFNLMAQVDNLTVEDAIEKYAPAASGSDYVSDSILPDKDVKHLVSKRVRENKEEIGVKRILKPGYLKQFKISDVAYKYLRSRGIPTKISKEFNVRYSDFGYFSGRVIFPLYNTKGKLISVSGRSITTNVGDEKMRHLPHSDHSSGVFGYMQVKKLIKSKKLNYIVLCEGQIDAMSLYYCGIPAVAVDRLIAGEEQIQIMSTLADLIIIGVDCTVEKKQPKGLAKLKNLINGYCYYKRIIPKIDDWNQQLQDLGRNSIIQMFKGVCV